MSHITHEITDNIAILRINRPDKLNALNTAVLTELLKFLTSTALSQQLKAVVLTGTGEKAFIAGADIKEMQSFTSKQAQDFFALGQNVANALETAPFVTIAAVNGYALGGGLEMALACDFIYAQEKAVLGLPEVTLGLIPGFGGTQRLARAVGTRLAKELIMSARTFTAEEGKEIGVVNRVLPADRLLQESIRAAQKITINSHAAILGVKNAINCGIELDALKAYELERNICSACFDTVERQTEMKAFLDKKR